MLRTKIKHTLRLGLIFILSYNLSAQDHIMDDNTSALIHFNSYTGSTEFESASTSSGISYYSNGKQGSAANFYGASNLQYNAEDNINAGQGSFEAWVRPNWNGNDGQNHAILSWGNAGGMLIVKDAAGNLRLILNKYGTHPNGNEVGIAYNVNDWSAGQWHHITFNWSTYWLRMYIDGTQVGIVNINGNPPPPISASTFYLGSDNGSNKFQGQIDEVRISKFTRSAADVAYSYNNPEDGVRHDNSSTIIMRFNNSTDAEVLENAHSSQFISLLPGLLDRSGYFNQNENLQYNAAGNINSGQGSFEAWLKPSFEPQPGGGDHTILQWGSFGGMLIFVNGGSTLRFIVNRYSANGNFEININYDIQDWNINEWHHIAYTWNSDKLKLYIDGSKVSESDVNFSIANISDAQFRIGADAGSKQWHGWMDEIRISDNIRSEEEIARSFLNGLNITSLTLKENNVELYPNWRYRPEVCGTSGSQTFDLNPTLLDWTSSSNWRATVGSDGIIHTHNPGNPIVTGTIDGMSVPLSLSIQNPQIDPAYQDIDPLIATPAECSKEEMKVVILCYFPTQDGVHLDAEETGPDLGGGPYPLNDIEDLVADNNIMMKHMLEERTKFRGYKNPDADPYLGYEVVDVVYVYEPMPRFLKVPFQGNIANGTINFMDVPKMAERFDFEDYVDNQDVDEVWIWGYHHDVPDGIFGWESEMSSPTTGSISNSHSFTPLTDLPVYSKTYTVYGFNYGRTPNLHNQGHQLEAMFKYIDFDMFQEKFVGAVNSNPPLGRAGDTHRPPNTTVDYDYLNPTLVASDIEDWEPNGGPTKMVNVNTWAALDYNWPNGNIPPAETEVNYYIYWMQSMPGYQNTIPYNGQYMTNWWEFVANWDDAINNNLGLFANTPSGVSPNDDCLEDSGCSEFTFNSFEPGWEGWIDGGSDCVRSTAYPNTGNISVRLRDNSGVASSVTSPISDWSGASSVKVEFSYYPKSMETNEDFWLQVSTNGGASYSTVKTWKRGTDFENDIRYNEVVNIEGINFTANSRIRFRCDASGNWDYVYIDDVKISTCSNCPEFSTEGFESGWGIWNDGGSDCVRTSGNPGSTPYSIRLRDNTNTSVMTTDNLSLAGYESVSVDFHYYPVSMETNEDFWLQISTNGGSSYSTVGSWKRGTDFDNGVHYDESVGINGPFTNNTRIRFRCDASTNADYVYIDDVVIRTCSSGADFKEEEKEIVIETRQVESDVKIFPNPVSNAGKLYIQAEDSEQLEEVQIFDIQGRLIKQMDWMYGDIEREMNMDGIAVGAYNLHLVYKNAISTYKLIVVE